MAKKVVLDLSQQPLSGEVKARILALSEATTGREKDFPILLHDLMHQVAKEQRDADSSELTQGALQKPLVVPAPPTPKPALPAPPVPSVTKEPAPATT